MCLYLPIISKNYVNSIYFLNNYWHNKYKPCIFDKFFLCHLRHKFKQRQQLCNKNETNRIELIPNMFNTIKSFTSTTS